MHKIIGFLLAFLTGLSLLAFSGSAIASKPSQLPLMPWPQKVEMKEGEFVVDKPVVVKFNEFESKRLQASAARFSTKMNSHLEGRDKENGTIVVHVDVKSGPLEASKILDADESYQLSISEEGISISSAQPYGAMHGFQTLLQLAAKPTAGKFVLPNVDIKDFPRFKWRGLMLDPARHFLPVEDIKRQIDGMESAKLNVFHWHLTDDQGWRIESKRFPKLHELASDGDYYTQEQLKDVVHYAFERGIRVLPEVDVPGHGSAIAVAYPELMSLPGPNKMEREWGVHKPTLNPINAKAYEFVDGIVAELSDIFPDPYFHIGGDEVKPYQWQKNKDIQSFIKSNQLVDYKGLQAYFNQRVNKILQKHQKRMVGWDEIVHPTLSDNIVVQSWRGHDSVNHKIKNGRQSLLSTGYYVDQAQPTSYHYRNDPIPQQDQIAGDALPGEQWETWSFVIPRLRGSAVKGSFTLFTNEQGNVRGFIDFNGRSRRKLDNIQLIGEESRFTVDTWMGRLTPNIVLSGKDFDGEAVVANGRYPMRGEKIAGSDIFGSTIPKGIILETLTAKDKTFVLGGEATLWGENVIPSVLDIRLWPRTYAIAERFWSEQSVNDVESMYERMHHVSVWAEDVVGLEHRRQGIEGMLRLQGDKNIEPLVVLSQAIEQAQYYHRHHAKGQVGEYHQQAPLNRFVDTLPVESIETRNLQRWVNHWLKNTSDSMVEKKLSEKLNAWLSNAEVLYPQLQQSNSLSSIAPIAKSVADVSQAGLMLMNAIANNQTISPKTYRETQEILRVAMQIREEIVVSSAYAVEALLFRAANITDNTVNHPLP